jgi:RND superfamily putative drug exporter
MLQADEGARQMGFAMAFGILIASLVVSSVLVPALTVLLGRRAFGTRPTLIAVSEPALSPRG